MDKAHDAFLTIGELAQELGVPQHVLRYWETRFPQLRPLQRSGNRRYYRPGDVSIARRIYTLLNVEGFTVRGAQQALKKREPRSSGPVEAEAATDNLALQPQSSASSLVSRDNILGRDDLGLLITRLADIRSLLQDAVEPG
jgi:DNA-binding transcriptional MerR regulator